MRHQHTEDTLEYHVGEAFNVLDLNVGELHVEELVHGLKGAHQGHVILQLHLHLLAHERLEERVEYLDVPVRPEDGSTISHGRRTEMIGW